MRKKASKSVPSTPITSPKIARIAVADQSMTVWTKDPLARVEFIGPAGAMLDARATSPDGVSYRLRDEDAWVRARVVDSKGARAWTQPFRTTLRDP